MIDASLALKGTKLAFQYMHAVTRVLGRSNYDETFETFWQSEPWLTYQSIEVSVLVALLGTFLEHELTRYIAMGLNL